MAAGDNEKLFKTLMEEKFGESCLKGKQHFELQLKENEKVSISVDESLTINGKEILIEIDSGNMAKLIAGQYALLDGIYTGTKTNTLFLVIHYYKDKNQKFYNRDRTLKNLNAIQSFNSSNTWIPFNAYNIHEFEKILEEISTLEELLHKILPTTSVSN